MFKHFVDLNERLRKGLGPFGCALFSQALFRFSFGLVGTAIPALAAIEEGITAQAMSYISLAKAMPYILCAPLFGRAADNYDNRRILMAAEGLSALSSLAACVIFLSPVVDLRIFVAVTFLFSVLGVVLDTTLSGALSVAVMKQGDSRLNGWVQSTNSFADILSSLASGLMLGKMGGAVVFGVASCGLAIAFLFSILGYVSFTSINTAAGNGAARTSLRQATITIARHIRIRTLVISMAAWNGLHAAMMAMLALFVVRNLYQPSSAIGYIFAATGAGMLLGGLASTRLPLALRSPAAVGPALLAAALCWNFVSHLSGHSTTNVETAIALQSAFALFGFSMSLSVVAASTTRQAEIPAALQATLASLQMWANWGTMALGFLVGGMAGDRFGIPNTMRCIAALMLLPGVFLTLVLNARRARAGANYDGPV